MTFYQKIARIDYNSGVEPWEVDDSLNSRLGGTDYSVMWFIHGSDYLVEETDSDSFDVEVLGSFDDVGGDFYEVTDDIAAELQQSDSDSGEYRVAQIPKGDRLLVWEN